MFDFKMLDEWAREQEPVFIVGPERSGTSMMFRTLVSHPSFCSFDNATVETFCFVRPHALLDGPNPSNYEMRVYLGREFESFYESVAPIRGINKVCDLLSLPKSFMVENRMVVWNRRNYRELLRLFFYYSWLNLGKKRLAEKTPAHIRGVEQIFDCFPNAKVIICLRDPLEIIASHRKRFSREIELGKNPGDPSISWLNKTAEHYMQYFYHVNKLTLNACNKYKNNVKIVPYNVVTKSNEFLEQVFGFVGESYSDLDEVKSSAEDKSFNWDPLLASLPKNNSIEIQNWVTESEVSYVNSVLSKNKLLDWS